MPEHQPQIETIPNAPRIGYVSFAPPFSAFCSVGHRPFWGVVSIEFCPADRLLEFASVERFIGSYAEQHLTIEDFCRVIFDAVSDALGAVPLCVTVSAETTVHAPVQAAISRDWGE